MKKPTLKQVRAHFKDAKTIKTQYGKVCDIDLITEGHVPNTFMFKEKGFTIWTEEKGFAEILTTNN